MCWLVVVGGRGVIIMMDRGTHNRSLSNTSSSSSPTLSPAAHPQIRHPSLPISTVKRSQNVAAKAAAQRLAQVMATQIADHDDDDEDDDHDAIDFHQPPSHHRHRSISTTTNYSRPSISVGARFPPPPVGLNSAEHSTSVRSTSDARPSLLIRTTPMAPSSKTATLRTPKPITPVDPPNSRTGESRFIPVSRPLSPKDRGTQLVSSALHDELDMLREDNTNIVDKLNSAKERRKLAQNRATELEKQVASLGEGVSMETELLSRKEEELQRREAALKGAQANYGRDAQVSALYAEIQNMKKMTEMAVEQLHDAECEVEALRTLTQRMILTHEEMEEVVMKRCWLARYWNMAVQYGIYSDIAVSKHEHWSSLAPLPYEIVISTGQKAKEECFDKDTQIKMSRDSNDLTGEGNIETMLSVEMGLRELASLKVEEAVILALLQHRRLTPVQISDAELCQEEIDDILFKEAWLIYFWRRAKVHGVEEDISEERLQFWISRNGNVPTFHDVLDVERGLIELRKLGIDQLLWEASRRLGLLNPSHT